MRGMAVLLAVVLCCGCQRATTSSPDSGATAAPTASFANRVWASADSTAPPGSLRIFLGDGTLVMDSCWETYQLAKWRVESDSAISWSEGTAELQATIVELAAEHLVLRVRLAGEFQDQHYRAASAPYLCPDMPR